MFKDTENGHTNFCFNCEILQRKFDIYKDIKEFEIARYKQCLYEIEEICKKYNASQYIEEVHIAYWTNQILQKIKEVRGE